VGNATLARRQGIPTPARGNEKKLNNGRIPIFRVLYINFSIWSTTNDVDKRIQTLPFWRV